MQDGLEEELRAHFAMPRESRVVDVLSGVMLTLRDLTVFACDKSVLNQGTTWFPAYIACVESFYLNARLVAEFFVRMPSSDYTARTYSDQWEPPSQLADRLNQVWLTASKHVLHLSRQRVPTTYEDWTQEDLSFEALMAINRDAHAVFAAFVEHCEAIGADCAPMFREALSGTRPTEPETAAELHGTQRKAKRLAIRYEMPDPFASVWWPEGAVDD